MELTVLQQYLKMINKKGSAWIWILIVVILIIVAIVLFVVFSGSDGGGSTIFGGNNIPSPPALPN